MTCAWKSDKERVVLEIPDENSKNTTDSEVSSFRELLDEIEESAATPDFTINSHNLVKPKDVIVGQDHEGRGLRFFSLPLPLLEKQSLKNMLR